jgi:hypothetical protein
MPEFVGNDEFPKFVGSQMPSSAEFFFASRYIRYKSFFDEGLSFRRVCKCRAVWIKSSRHYYGFPVFGAHQNPSPFSNLCSGILGECPSKNRYVFATAFYCVVSAADKVLRRALVLGWNGSRSGRWIRART